MPTGADLATIDGTAYDLLREVKARISAQIPKLVDGLVMITDEPVPPDSYLPRGDIACTVCLSDGVFDEGLYIGGGANQLAEKSQLITTLITRNNIDQPPRLEVAMLNAERGILTRYKPTLLRALLVRDASAEVLQPWQPLKNGHPILRGCLSPSRSQGPRQLLGNAGWLGLSLYFDVEFDWELRAPVVE